MPSCNVRRHSSAGEWRKTLPREDKIASDIIFDELEAKHKDGYLFRGEPKEYDEVTSSLYRAGRLPGALGYVSTIEHDRVEACLRHCYEGAKIQKWKADGILQEHALKKLSEIQHFGGVTNLIDFTTCFYTALFFACDKWPEHDGRIIVIHPDLVPALNYVEPTNQDVLIPWGDYDYIRRDNGYPRERAEAQKSVFIHAKSGMLNADDYEVISIPSRFKTNFREGLSVNLKINRQSIYPDTIGFLQSSERPRQSIEYMLLAEQQLLKTRVYRYVIETCKKSTNESPHSYVYHIWGIAHLQLGEKQEAIDKFDRALENDDWKYQRGNDQNGARAATQTAKNIAEGKRGEYPTPGAIFSLNHSLGKGMPLPSSGGMMTLPHVLYAHPPYTLGYQKRRWHVLNLFYDYNELWDALPQLSEDELEETQEYRLKHEKSMADAGIFEVNLDGERIERSHDNNPEYYLDPEFYDPEFYRKLRDDEIENPLKSWMQAGGAEPPAHHNKEES